MDLAAFTDRLLLVVVLPLWLIAGRLDYGCHRRQRIETSAGVHEAMLHLVMLAELGIGVVAALLLEINAAVLALALTCAIAHEVTMWLDLGYATAHRRIPAFEQWVHGVQQAAPWIGVGLLLLGHWPQTLALVGLGTAPADWTLRWKSPPLPAWLLGAIAVAALLLVVLPFVRELVRCLAARGAPAVAR